MLFGFFPLPHPETTELGNKKELKSMPFITYLSGLLTAQMLSDDHLISGVEIHCEEKGRCPSTCHLCRRPGKEQLSPTPVLLEINRVVPLYALIQDNDTREVSEPVTGQPHLCDLTQPPLRSPLQPLQSEGVFLCAFGGQCCGMVSVTELAGPAAHHPQPSLTCISATSSQGHTQCQCPRWCAGCVLWRGLRSQASAQCFTPASRISDTPV